jgi:hypothetical protein
MNHEAFHIYTAKIGLPQNRSKDKSEIESEIKSQLPGINVEFWESESLTYEVIGQDANSARIVGITVENILDSFHTSPN